MLKEMLGASTAFQNYKKRNAHHYPLNSIQFFVFFSLYSEQVKVAVVQQSQPIGQRN